MGLYEDDSCMVNDIFDNDEGEAVAEFIDSNGDRHRLLRLSVDPACSIAPFSRPKFGLDWGFG